MIRLFITVIIITLFSVPAYASEKEDVKTGNMLYNAADYAGAAKAYEKALSARPDSAVASVNLGAALYKQDAYSKAIGSFNRAIATGNEEIIPKADFNIGNSYYRQGTKITSRTKEDVKKVKDLYEAALRYYKRAIDLDPSDQSAKYNYEFVSKSLDELSQTFQLKKDEQKDNKQDQQKQDQQQNQQQQNQQQQDQQQQDQKNQDQQQDQQDKQQQDQQNQQQDQQNQQDKQQGGGEGGEQKQDQKKDQDQQSGQSQGKDEQQKDQQPKDQEGKGSEDQQQAQGGKGQDEEQGKGGEDQQKDQSEKEQEGEQGDKDKQESQKQDSGQEKEDKSQGEEDRKDQGGSGDQQEPQRQPSEQQREEGSGAGDVMEEQPAPKEAPGSDAGKEGDGYKEQEDQGGLAAYQGGGQDQGGAIQMTEQEAKMLLEGYRGEEATGQAINMRRKPVDMPQPAKDW